MGVPAAACMAMTVVFAQTASSGRSMYAAPILLAKSRVSASEMMRRETISAPDMRTRATCGAPPNGAAMATSARMSEVVSGAKTRCTQ